MKIKGPDPGPNINWEAVIYRGVDKFQDVMRPVKFMVCRDCDRDASKPNLECKFHTWRINKTWKP